MCCQNACARLLLNIGTLILLRTPKGLEMGRFYLAAAIAVLPSVIYADSGDPHPGQAAPQAAKALAEMPPIAAELKSDKQKGSFAIGYNMGSTLRKQIGADTIDAAAFLQGMQQSLAGQKASLSSIEQERALKAFITTVQAQQVKKQAETVENNKKKGDEYLANNKKQKGVVVRPSGLQYQVLKEGSGKQPTASDEVQVHYHGTLLDGTVFDSSIDRGEPVTFRVNRVIPGWTEALQLMKEGSKVRVVIPPDLAYRQRGAPPKIGPNETLIFEIELLKVK
jgi:FKBP-type peptidyl-prolyl cis-trans isomerase FklB